MENIKQENGEIPKPIQLLGELDESLVVNHITDKKFVYSKETIPANYKALIALSVAIALDSQSCMAAKKSGATNEEIMEAYQSTCTGSLNGLVPALVE